MLEEKIMMLKFQEPAGCHAGAHQGYRPLPFGRYYVSESVIALKRIIRLA